MTGSTSLVILTDRADDDPEDLTGPIHYDRFVSRIRGDESESLSLLLEVLQGDFSLERGDDDIPILRETRSIEYDDISRTDSSIFHTVSFYLDEISTRRMLDQVFLEIDLTRRVCLGSEGESGTY